MCHTLKGVFGASSRSVASIWEVWELWGHCHGFGSLAEQLPASCSLERHKRRQATSLLSYLVIKRGWKFPENNWENDLSFGIFRATMIDMIDYRRVSTFLTQLFSCRRWHSSSCWRWSFVWLFPRMAHDLCFSISPIYVNFVKSLYQ